MIHDPLKLERKSFGEFVACYPIHDNETNDAVHNVDKVKNCSKDGVNENDVS